MDLLPPSPPHGPSHGPADRSVAPPPSDLPDVAESVTGRARDLHRLADQLSGAARGGADGEQAAPSPAVALLRAHAGAVDDLAEHLLAAGSATGSATEPPAAVDPAGTPDADPAGPRTAG